VSKSFLPLTPVGTAACCAPLAQEPLSADAAERTARLGEALAELVG